METSFSFPKPVFLDDYDVRGTVVVADNGCSYTVQFYIRGTHPNLRNFGQVRYQTACDGVPETELTYSGTRSCAPFAVSSERPAA